MYSRLRIGPFPGGGGEVQRSEPFCHEKINNFLLKAAPSLDLLVKKGEGVMISVNH